ncbi:MAG: alpha-L-arabinofuranosidase [Lachnospiraceae bacterium]|nr:alpha-L-arabinofuranosidase [Lachnospiraceae bacterium]
MKGIKVFQEKTYKELGDLYGLFFEDINHAADGGLYAELVQNRSFEFCEIDKPEYHRLTAWEKSRDCQWQILTEKPLNEENTHYLHVSANSGSYVANSGFNSSIFVEKDKEYTFSIYVRTSAKGAILKISVEDESRAVCAQAEVTLEASEEFVKYQVSLKGIATTWNGKLYITFEKDGTYDLDMVSLFPVDTYMGRENGLRKDIAQALADMKPKFMRFPGGCLTHDGALDDHARNSMYRWKRTLGPIEKRPSWRNNWRYNQTLGLGYYEYFCFCEDMGAKPLPVVPAGFNPHKGEGVALEEIGSWVQETLDLIEFANGDETTTMGKVRSEMGHPAPFGLEYLGVGNEEIGAGFFERYPYFHKAIREKYPDIKIINTAGPFAVGEGYEDGWRSAREHGSDLIDEHYYSSPEWFLANMHHYEDYDEKGPKVFLGEYASWGNTYYNAIVEAAYMTHLERSKAVALACYAPMLCNVDYVNWQPDMLWFDNHRIMKTPNYYVQKMFMENQGTDAAEFEMQELDEIIPLTDEVNLTGGITITGNDVTGSIWDVQVEEDGTRRSLEDLQITDNAQHELTNITGKKFSLTFKFKRDSGRKGLKIYFGKRDDKNFLQWEFGGWDNWDCNIGNISKGRGSTISHRIFHVEDMEYTLKLEVDGRHIKTYVNGENYNDVTDRLPEIEELYVTASVDKEQGTTIVKAVNLTGEEKNVLLSLDGGEKKQAEITSLAGCALDAVNTLDEPDNITTKKLHMTLIGNQLTYTFPPHSVTVMVFS